MSTRFYPRYVRGNPQLRVFLPDWTLTMVKPKDTLPENVVVFRTDIKMTDWDIKNYLQKIYKLDVAHIRSRVLGGDLRKSAHGISAHESYRLAYITLPVGQKFTWPDLYPEEKRKEEESDYQTTRKELSKNRSFDPNKLGIPGWFN